MEASFLARFGSEVTSSTAAISSARRIMLDRANANQIKFLTNTVVEDVTITPQTWSPMSGFAMSPPANSGTGMSLTSLSRSDISPTQRCSGSD